MTTTQTASHVKRFLKEKIHNELVPALEQLVEELPDDLVEFSEVEQMLRVRFLKLAGDMLRGWSEVAVTRISIPEWGTEGNPQGYVYVKCLTSIEKERAEELFRELSKEGIENYRACMVAAALCNAHGERIFNPKLLA